MTMAYQMNIMLPFLKQGLYIYIMICIESQFCSDSTIIQKHAQTDEVMTISTP